jgi:YVTN family beta-propeller protein
VRRGLALGGLLGALGLQLGCDRADPGDAQLTQEDLRSKGGRRGTYSSPIALSRSGRLVWSVNPADDTVSVIRTDTRQMVAKIPVGDEPQGVAVDAFDRFAVVANTAAGTISTIWVDNPDPDHFKASVRKLGGREELATGSEPWNIVLSPDGRRVFVANSADDTITVVDPWKGRIVANVDLRNSLCNDPDRERHFQPRGLAVTADSSKLYVTRFLSFVKRGGEQGDDDGKEGLVCRLDIDTHAEQIGGYQPAATVTLRSQLTGFKADTNLDGVFESDTRAFPNQLQSIVIRGDQAYLPGIAASPSGPLRFNVDTQAFVNVIDGVNGDRQRDASAAKFKNLHLGARNPEPGKQVLFFANVWAIAFTSEQGAGNAYVVSAGSDLLVKLNVAADGKLDFTVDEDTTRYIDLNDPTNPRTSGANAGKNPQGIVISDDGKTAYVANFVSRNVSVVDLTTDTVVATVQTADLPPPGSRAETVLVGAEMFFSSRGHFDRPPGATISTENRLSQTGWQNCASCHFKGLTDSVVWVFNTGPRKSIALNGTFNPHDPDGDQRILNYSAVMDEVEDFDANIRNVSGPGPLMTAVTCNNGVGNRTSTLDPNHGLIISDAGDFNTPPCDLNALRPPKNADRNQVTVTLPGSDRGPIPAMTALREWVKLAIRTPQGPTAGKDRPWRWLQARTEENLQVRIGRNLFDKAGCATCHAGGKWTISTRDFQPPPDLAELASERTGMFQDEPIGADYLHRFLVNIGSFNIGVPPDLVLVGTPRPFDGNIAAPELATATRFGMVVVVRPGGLGFDYTVPPDGKGNGFNVPSLLGIHAVPPYYHNGACETLACVLRDERHRTANGTLPDILQDRRARQAVVKFVESIDADTEPFPLAMKQDGGAPGDK